MQKKRKRTNSTKPILLVNAKFCKIDPCIIVGAFLISTQSEKQEYENKKNRVLKD